MPGLVVIAVTTAFCLLLVFTEERTPRFAALGKLAPAFWFLAMVFWWALPLELSLLTRYLSVYNLPWFAEETRRFVTFCLIFVVVTLSTAIAVALMEIAVGVWRRLKPTWRWLFLYIVYRSNCFVIAKVASAYLDPRSPTHWSPYRWATHDAYVYQRIGMYYLLVGVPLCLLLQWLRRRYYATQ